MRIVFSTDDIPMGERFDRWRELVTQSFPAMRLERRTREPFFGSAEIEEIDHIQIATVHSIAQRGFLDRQTIGRAPEAFYAVNLQLEGTSIGEQEGDRWVAKPGDIDILDTTYPGVFGMDEKCRGFLMLIPQARLRPYLSTPDRMLGMHIRGGEGQGLGRLLSTTLRTFAGERNFFGLNASSAIHLCLDALARAMGVTLEAAQLTAPSMRELRRQRFYNYVEQLLPDSSLSPEKIANALQISTSHLHKLLEEVETSPMKWVLSRRLERCRIDLADRTKNARKIADIAFSWGFKELSHFNHAFKAAYRMTPGEWRVESQRDTR